MTKRITTPDRHASPLWVWRTSRNLTLQDVAGLTGLSPAMLSRVERGERQLHPLTKVRVARCLGARVADLFEPEPESNSKKAASI